MPRASPDPAPPRRAPLRLIALGVAIWLPTGYLVLFAANGGAAGSAAVTDFAWACLAVYTVLFAALFVRFVRRRAGNG